MDRVGRKYASPFAKPEDGFPSNPRQSRTATRYRPDYDVVASVLYSKSVLSSKSSERRYGILSAIGRCSPKMEQATLYILRHEGIFGFEADLQRLLSQQIAVKVAVESHRVFVGFVDGKGLLGRPVAESHSFGSFDDQVVRLFTRFEESPVTEKST